MNPKMEVPNVDHQHEFEELTDDLSDVMLQMSDPVAIGAMLYSIAEEKKSSNLIVREINAKFDNIAEKLEKIYGKLAELTETGISQAGRISAISDRDQEILEFVKSKGKVCADDVQEKFGYRGRNAASARLSRLFKDDILDKIYHGRNVYYVIRS